MVFYLFRTLDWDFMWKISLLLLKLLLKCILMLFRGINQPKSLKILINRLVALIMMLLILLIIYLLFALDLLRD